MTQPFNVVSVARKVVFALQPGPIASFPEGAVVNNYGQNNDIPVIVVENGTDGTWQGADGAGYVIVNEVFEDTAVKALSKLAPNWWDLLLGRKPNDMVVRALGYLKERGYVDQYTTNSDFYDNNLSPAGLMIGESGIMKRDGRDLCEVFYDQLGELRIFTDALRDIEPRILLDTYRMPDGSEIDLKNIPQKNISEDKLLENTRSTHTT